MIEISAPQTAFVLTPRSYIDPITLSTVEKICPTSNTEQKTFTYLFINKTETLNVKV